MVISVHGLWTVAVAMLVCGLAISSGSAEPANSAEQAKLELGKKVFLEISEPRCSLCHTLNDATALGQIGPVLDKLRPSAERVKAAVTNGVGVMPAFEALTEEQVDAVALYVSEVSGK